MTRLYVAGREKIKETGRYRNSVYELETEIGRTRTIIGDFPHTFSALGRLSIRYDDLRERPMTLPPRLASLASPAELKEIDEKAQQKSPPQNLGRKEDLEYLLAGYRFGIEIQNLGREDPDNHGSRIIQERKKIVVSLERSPLQRFNYIGVLQPNGITDRTQVIVASHDYYGALQIPLSEVENTVSGTVQINLKEQKDRERYLIVPGGIGKDQDLVRARVVNNKLYVAKGNRFYETDEKLTPSGLNQPTVEISQGEQISCFDVRNGDIWFGTSTGGVYQYSRGEGIQQRHRLGLQEIVDVKLFPERLIIISYNSGSDISEIKRIDENGRDCIEGVPGRLNGLYYTEEAIYTLNIGQNRAENKIIITGKDFQNRRTVSLPNAVAFLIDGGK